MTVLLPPVGDSNESKATSLVRLLLARFLSTCLFFSKLRQNIFNLVIELSLRKPRNKRKQLGNNGVVQQETDVERG